MVAIASRARVLSTFAAAGATLIAALALTPREELPPDGCPTAPRAHGDDGLSLTAGWRAHGEGPHLVVTVAAPAATPVRPPLSVAIVIDRSRSMSGEPFAHAKLAAARLVSQLDAGDAFSVIAYSDGRTTVVPMLRATAAHKDLALRAIEELAVDNGTCISCGLGLGGEWLAQTPVEQGVRRMVLISDGYANLGLRDRDELVQLAADTAARGVSITAVGVGLDFDEQTMMRIAEVGRGNYYYVEDSGRLDAAFDREVAGLAGTVATGVRLTVQLPPGVELGGGLGYEAATVPGAVSIPVADLRAGEVRRIVLRLSPPVTGSAAGAGVPCGIVASLDWRRAIDGARRAARAPAVPADAGEAAAVEWARAGVALARAADIYESGRADHARLHLEWHGGALDEAAGIDPGERSAIRARLAESAAAFATRSQPERAMKQVRELARALAREPR